MAAQKLARKRREEETQTRRLAAARAKIAKIEPIEEHVPHAWRNLKVRIEPLFDQTMLESPAQIGFAQMAEAINRQHNQPQAQEPAIQNTPAAFEPAAANTELISHHDLAREQHMDLVRRPVMVQASAMAGSAAKLSRPTRAQVLFERLRLWVRRMLAMLSRMQGPGLTPSGMMTLRQLQRLYALIGAGWTTDDMEMVRLRVAYGEAYYQVMEASRRRKTNRRKDEPAEYQAYIERFLAAEQY